ncbi:MULTISPECIES: hypothetical protein [Bradyrhizobium]|uniref:Uncharacterized protein n=1 Tax=Bradyrhizobium brasilense TaxID=1419277 RepID=A0ABY8JL14_9BRAD|nr:MULTISPECIES: hypothetical protein [Bradyrhizobium]MCP1912029.1 hypothetical protein [Bradyrhizobium elkanii]MCP1829639.1 hypothetical protein [Bradyrhizobium sp. USDA 4545]MCP1848243.1 hypothetical protein [Bradyrhizobium sp. USDA 4541]MCP1922748.1 hypothetical protein [Bradyrhizobium sp. USDA 4532]WFU64738.1 hypothetical protein QA636_04060 [Bradyrhizobium brasilense]
MVSHGCGGAIARSGFDSAIISHGRVVSSPVGSICMQECLARLHPKISRIAMSTAMTRACDHADCVIIDRGVSDRLAAERYALRNVHGS